MHEGWTPLQLKEIKPYIEAEVKAAHAVRGELVHKYNTYMIYSESRVDDDTTKAWFREKARVYHQLAKHLTDEYDLPMED